MRFWNKRPNESLRFRNSKCERKCIMLPFGVILFVYEMLRNRFELQDNKQASERGWQAVRQSQANGQAIFVGWMCYLRSVSHLCSYRTQFVVRILLHRCRRRRRRHSHLGNAGSMFHVTIFVLSRLLVGGGGSSVFKMFHFAKPPFRTNAFSSRVMRAS